MAMRRIEDRDMADCGPCRRGMPATIIQVGIRFWEAAFEVSQLLDIFMSRVNNLSARPKRRIKCQHSRLSNHLGYQLQCMVSYHLYGG